MGSNYPNQKEENNNTEENISFPTEENYAVFEPEHCEKPLVSRDVLERPSYAKKKSNTAVIVLLSVLLFLLVVLLVAVIALSNAKKGGTDEQGFAITEEQSGAKDESANPFPRYSTYNSSYSYTSMPDIYYTSESDDEKCFEMAEFIKDFNNAWINYINYGNTSVYTYLREGTKPYQYAVSYGQKNLTEEYQTMTVHDVREYNGTYYVWTYEVINKYYDGKTEQAVYHWIYKIGKDGDGYYVELYKKDPYYK